MAKILFINPPLRRNTYLTTHVGVAAPGYPSLTLATLAGHLTANHTVRIVDLDLRETLHAALLDEIEIFKPEIIATSVVTPVYPVMRDIMAKVKENHPDITTIVGGVHVTALPDEAVRDRCFDIVVCGEADTVIPELLSARSFQGVPGIFYKDKMDGEFKYTANRTRIGDLNALPFPAWDLFPICQYKNSRISSRRNPVGLIETSRGCAFRCVFCNKLTFGQEYRTKEPKRVVDEMEYMLSCGFEEIHIVDDSFTQDIHRAKEICGEIINRNLKFPWSLINGVRVDMVDSEFFMLARRSGCWQAGFGIETGDQHVLNKIDKHLSLAQTERAVRLAKKAGIDTFGFFIFALPEETEKSMMRTIEFAAKLPLDIAKFDICIPYPGTPYYRKLKLQNRIITEDWSRYNCHQIDQPLFSHPNLDWHTISAYYRKAFIKFYLRPSYIIRRLIRSVKKGDLMHDIYYFSKSRW